jgi:hypothetical protein
MPASAAQVFGPVTVDPGFNSTGEKTLLVMNTTLPAGGKNVIIVFVGVNGSAINLARGTFRIKKGSTILYGDVHTFYLNYSRSYAYIAVDDNPTGNDAYVATINITSVGSSASVHVQGVVIKADDVNWAYNNTAVNIAAGSTATVVSLTTNYPPNSKVVAIMILDGYRSDGSYGHTYIGAGSVRLKLGTTVLTSNPYALGSYMIDLPGWWILVWGGIVTSAPQTWNIEVYNNSTPTVPYGFFGAIVTFTVSDFAFLDSASSTLSNTSLTTVGNMATTLAGDVVVLAIPSGGNTTSNAGLGFPTGYIVLQKDNDVTTQIDNKVAQYLDSSSSWMRAQMYFLARVDISTSNPSYQVKMRAGWNGINGEAKILAFVLFTGLTIKRVFGETVRELEGSIFGRSRFRISAESVNLNELRRAVRNLVRMLPEAVYLVESVVGSRIWVKVRGEGVGISEVFRILRRRFRLISESLRVSEAISRSCRLFRPVAENVSLSEAISRVRIMARLVGEIVRSLEATVRSRIINRVAGEVMRIFEAFSSFKGAVRAIVEGLQLSESTRKVRDLSRIVAEQVRISEIVSKVGRFVKVLAESLNLAEAFRAVRHRFRSVGESLGITELSISFKGAVRIVGESLNLGEISGVLRRRFRQISEAINIGEASARIQILIRAILESVVILESRSVSRFLSRVVSRAVAIEEALVKFRGSVLAIVEGVRVMEAKLFRRIKTYIDRLVSALRGTAVGGEV